MKKLFLIFLPLLIFGQTAPVTDAFSYWIFDSTYQDTSLFDIDLGDSTNDFTNRGGSFSDGFAGQISTGSPIKTDGSALSFASASNDHLRINNGTPGSADFEMGTGDFGVIGWIRTSTDASQQIVGKSINAGVNSAGWAVSIDVNEHINFKCHDGVDFVTMVEANVDVVTGGWHIFYAWRDGTGFNLQVPPDAVNTTVDADVGDLTNGFLFGIGKGNQDNTQFNGDIAAIFVFNRALTAADITYYGSLSLDAVSALGGYGQDGQHAQWKGWR